MVAGLPAVLAFENGESGFEFLVKEVGKSLVQIDHRLLERQRVIFFEPAFPPDWARVYGAFANPLILLLKSPVSLSPGFFFV